MVKGDWVGHRRRNRGGGAGAMAPPLFKVGWPTICFGPPTFRMGPLHLNGAPSLNALLRQPVSLSPAVSRSSQDCFTIRFAQ